MSNMCRKRIAVLLSQPEEYYHERFLKGFLKEAFARDYDVCMFAMYIKYQNSPARCIGETSIYGLVSYDKFDAVVVMADTIKPIPMIHFRWLPTPLLFRMITSSTRETSSITAEKSIKYGMAPISGTVKFSRTDTANSSAARAANALMFR